MAEEFVAILTDGFEYEECDLELLELILRGSIGGQSHPIAKLTFVDDDGSEVEITSALKRMEIISRRDDRRTDQAILAPPTSTLRVSLENIDKKFTPGAGGIFDGKMSYGRVLNASIGYIINGTRCFFAQGQFLLDDLSLDVSPGATTSITARDKLSLALDREISMRSFAGRADEYIAEVLAKVGIIISGSNSEIFFPQTLLTFVSTPVFIKKRAIDILSDVLIRIQTEKPFRLIQVGNIINLVEIPKTGIAEIVFHFQRDMKNPFSRRERSNQARSVTTVIKTTPSNALTDTVFASFTGDGTDFTGSPPRKILSYGVSPNDVIRVEWRQGDSDTLLIKETRRSTNDIEFGPQNAADAGNGALTWTVTVRGDRIDGFIAGEAGPGIDQGGIGLGMRDPDGNELNTITLRRGKTFEQVNGFVTNDTEVQDLAEILQSEFGPPVRELTMSLVFANPTLQINDLFRIVEKYSEDRELYHMAQIRHLFVAGAPSLVSTIVGQFANIAEIPQDYDKAFPYNQGRIYDDRIAVGNEQDQDLSFRGATILRTRP